MRMITLLTALVLAGCEYSEDNLQTGKGVYACVSNSGRPTLTFDSKTLNLSRIGLREFVVTFTDLKSGHIYRLHSTEDRDYSCGRKLG